MLHHRSNTRTGATSKLIGAPGLGQWLEQQEQVSVRLLRNTNTAECRALVAHTVVMAIIPVRARRATAANRKQPVNVRS